MFQKRSSSFGIILNNELITNLPVARKDMLGIEIDQTSIPGIVSMYEEHEARREAGYNLIEWMQIGPRERALEVALLRIDRAMEYQKYKAQEREALRNSRKGR